MKRRWWILWMFLLLGQLLFGWLLKSLNGEDPLDPTRLPKGPSALALYATQERSSPGGMPGSPSIPDELTSGQELLRREALLMRMRSCEAVLLSAGAEAAFTSDLEAWMERRETLPGTDAADASRYLESVLLWLEPFLDPDSPDLRSLRVQPDRQGDYPCLSIEVPVGSQVAPRALHSQERSGRDWQLLEMDVFRSGEETEWWMRGCYAFRQSD